MLGSTKLFKDLPQDLGDEVLEEHGQYYYSINHKEIRRGGYNAIPQLLPLITKCVGNA